MTKSPIHSLFDSPQPKSEEEKKKEAEEKQKENNPFLKKKTVNMDKGVGAYRISLDNMGDSIEKHYYHFQKFFTRHKDTSFGAHAVKLLNLKMSLMLLLVAVFMGRLEAKSVHC